MAYLYGDPVFNTNQRRNQAVTFLNNEAAARGLVAAVLDIYGPGAAAATIDGKPGLRCCWSGPFAVIDVAHRDLNEFIDSNGQVDGSFSTLNND